MDRDGQTLRTRPGRTPDRRRSGRRQPGIPSFTRQRACRTFLARAASQTERVSSIAAALDASQCGDQRDSIIAGDDMASLDRLADADEAPHGRDGIGAGLGGGLIAGGLDHCGCPFSCSTSQHRSAASSSRSAAAV